MVSVLAESDWHARRAAHEERVRPWIESRLMRTSVGQKHPVEDFLFEYYSFRPGQLLRWHPGIGFALENGDEYLSGKGYRKQNGAVWADPGLLPPARRANLAWVRDMLEATASRPPSFGCFGLHEWAMVYRSPHVRHERWPLRFDPATIAGVVESLPIRCTHYDAFRFFTPAARPLNRWQPTRETVISFEQPGCLHANMDLYKWAFKLTPYVSSEFLADTFALAREIRQLDMQASPYDLRSLGLDPVPIETPEGRLIYEQAQRQFTRRAEPLRRKLIALYDEILRQAPPPLRPVEVASQLFPVSV